jgi:hypothetical protein
MHGISWNILTFAFPTSCRFLIEHFATEIALVHMYPPSTKFLTVNMHEETVIFFKTKCISSERVVDCIYSRSGRTYLRIYAASSENMSQESF